MPMLMSIALISFISLPSTAISCMTFSEDVFIMSPFSLRDGEGDIGALDLASTPESVKRRIPSRI